MYRHRFVFSTKNIFKCCIVFIIHYWWHLLLQFTKYGKFESGVKWLSCLIILVLRPSYFITVHYIYIFSFSPRSFNVILLLWVIARCMFMVVLWFVTPCSLSCTWLPAVRRNVSLTYYTPKIQAMHSSEILVTTRPHCVRAQKTTVDSFIAMGTSNFECLVCVRRRKRCPFFCYRSAI
jgi:hypothetical protein